jgi:FkbM family methyltransferase
MISRQEAQAQRQGRPENWLLRIYTYLRDGILFRRIGLRIYYIRRDLKQAWWDRQKRRKRPSFSYRLKEGARMRLSFDSELCRELYVRGFEEKERAFHKAFLRPGDVYVDIGANIGLFSLIAARRVGPGGRVYAIEPVSATFRQLQDNVRMNRFGNVIACQTALSEKPGQAEIYLSSDGLDGFNSIAKPHTENYSTEQIAVTTLDDFARQQGISGRIAMIKLDVEGWESHVLAGGKAELAAPGAPVIQIEFSTEGRLASGVSSAELYGMLVKLGYQVFDYDPFARCLLPTNPEDADREYVNLFAVKDRARVEARLGKKRSA